MGEIPCRPIFRIKLWFAVTVIVSATASGLGEQLPAAQNPSSPPPNAAVPIERKTLSLDELPAEKKADLLMARGQYAAAITAYQQSNLKSAIVWNNIGMAYHHLYALDQARRAYQQSLSLNPRFAAADNNLAAVYYGQHEFRVAEHFYKKAIKHSKESAVIYCNLGTAYFAEQKYKKGVKMYQKAFSIDPDVFAPNQAAMVEGGGSREQRVAINYYIAQTFAKAGKQDQALIFLRKAMDEGFKDRKRLDEDQDFAVLRTTPQFQQLLTQENLN
ncbi:MAG TPA: tetratricopeptide repeat protein [Acidobacteriaceae bacterium]|nr:tetratricopeptide repeat protein [Acidobacteriaceae bacterium]